MTEPLVFLGERFLAASDEARVSLFDRGYLLGDSIFETLRAYDGAVFALDAHLERLERASAKTGIAIPRSRESIAALVQEGLARCKVGNAYVRVTVSRGDGAQGLATTGCDTPIFSIVIRSLTPYSVEAYTDGIVTRVVQTRKVPAICIDPTIKTGSCLSSVLARRELETAGLVEGIQLSVDGLVVSGVVSNLFLVAGGRLHTPAEASGCRLGVTRTILLDLAHAMGIPVDEGPLRTDDLGRADEAFFANTLMECLPIRRIEPHERALGSTAPSSMTLRLLAAYRENVRKLRSS